MGSLNLEQFCEMVIRLHLSMSCNFGLWRKTSNQSKISSKRKGRSGGGGGAQEAAVFCLQTVDSG